MSVMSSCKRDVNSISDDDVKVIELSDNEIYKRFALATPAFPSGFVKLEPFNQILPRVILKDLQKIKAFEAKRDDVWISSFPKCGTTWTQEMVWCIMNDLDFRRAESTSVFPALLAGLASYSANSAAISAANFFPK